MNVAEAAGAALARAGVTHAFGVVGSGNFATTAALVRGGARFVASRQETAAVAMADGHARISLRPTVASVHQGPGFTNALTGMIEAAKASSPVLLVTAATPEAWTHSNFLIDQAAMAEAGGVAVERVTEAGDTAATLERAWRRVAANQATVLLLPLDVQKEEASPITITATAPAPVEPDAAALVSAAGLLAGAERPVIIAGRGVTVSGARDAVCRLAEASGALLATSLGGHGLFAGDPFSLGISGGFATDLAVELISDADVVVVIGASANRWTTRHGRMLGEGAQIIHVDSRPAAIGRHREVTLGVLGDAALAAEALTAAVAERRKGDPGYRTDAVRRRIAEGGFARQPFEDASTADRVDPRAFSRALNAILPADRLLVLDGGHFSGWPVMYLDIPDASGFVPNQSFQSIGLGLGSAVGAALARPDRLTVAAVGDGGTFMALGELETAARIGLPMLIVVYNDDAYGAEVHHFADDGEALDLVRFPPTDLAAVARAVGCDGITVRTVDDLSGLRGWLDKWPSRPLLVDAKVSPTVVGAWLPEAFRA